jgi:hypothetical protein
MLNRGCPLWVKSDVFGALADVRFTPESDRLLQRREMTLCAISDQSALQHLVGSWPRMASVATSQSVSLVREPVGDLPKIKCGAIRRPRT